MQYIISVSTKNGLNVQLCEVMLIVGNGENRELEIGKIMKQTSKLHKNVFKNYKKMYLKLGQHQEKKK